MQFLWPFSFKLELNCNSPNPFYPLIKAQVAFFYSQTWVLFDLQGVKVIYRTRKLEEQQAKRFVHWHFVIVLRTGYNFLYLVCPASSQMYETQLNVVNCFFPSYNCVRNS